MNVPDFGRDSDPNRGQIEASDAIAAADAQGSLAIGRVYRTAAL
jgi:hypothetical protein